MARKTKEQKVKLAKKKEKEKAGNSEIDNKEIEHKGIETYYTVKEVAEILKLNHKTVRVWMKQGKLNYVLLKPGIKDKYRIKESELKKVIEEGPTIGN